jgi:hypothetical protein
MIKINYPPPSFAIKQEAGGEIIFDGLRKKWVTLTPEEWVRQNLVQYLLQTLQYPASHIAVEREIRLGERRKRFDILVFDKNGAPWLMIECKSMDVPLDEKVLQQLVQYNMATPVPYLFISNGSYCWGASVKAGGVEVMEDFPVWD